MLGRIISNPGASRKGARQAALRARPEKNTQAGALKQNARPHRFARRTAYAAGGCGSVPAAAFFALRLERPQKTIPPASASSTIAMTGR